MSATTDRTAPCRGRSTDRSRSVLPRRGLAAVAVVTLALVLSGCSLREPGAAAVIGDRRVSTEQVTHAVEGIRTGNPELAQGEGLDRTVLFFLILSPFVLEQAEKAGAGVSDFEARAQLPKTDDPDPDAVQVLRTFLALQKLQQGGATDALTAVQADITAAKVRVNPRFGKLDTADLQIVDGQPNWLVPVAAPPPADGTQTPPPTP